MSFGAQTNEQISCCLFVEVNLSLFGAASATSVSLGSDAAVCIELRLMRPIAIRFSLARSTSLRWHLNAE